jgi:hypothetical protein
MASRIMPASTILKIPKARGERFIAAVESAVKFDIESGFNSNLQNCCIVEKISGTCFRQVLNRQ